MLTYSTFTSHNLTSGYGYNILVEMVRLKSFKSLKFYEGIVKSI